MFWISPRSFRSAHSPSVAYTAGKVVELYEVKVNYTRKVNFLAIFLAEAKASHTWDTPSMFLAGTASLFATTTLI